MGKYILTKEDYNNLNKLFNVENKIINIYGVLEKLEVNNKKDSEEYKNALNSLRGLLNLEEVIFLKIGDNPARISELLFYLSGYQNVDTNEFLKISEFLQEDTIKSRIIIKLEHLLNHSEFPRLEEKLFENQEYPDINFDEIDFEKLSELPPIEELEKDFFYSEKLGYETERDLLNTVLIILSEYLFSSEYKDIHHLLIKFKYQLAFLFKQIELIFLDNSFTIDPTLVWGANLVVDQNNSDPQDLELVKESYAEDVLYSQSENFIKLLSEDLDDVENYGKAIVCQIIVRASLLFVKEKTRKDFISYLMMEIYYAKTTNIKMTEIIRNSINKYDVDGNLPHILRLKLD